MGSHWGAQIFFRYLGHLPQWIHNPTCYFFLMVTEVPVAILVLFAKDLQDRDRKEAKPSGDP